MLSNIWSRFGSIQSNEATTRFRIELDHFCTVWTDTTQPKSFFFDFSGTNMFDTKHDDLGPWSDLIPSTMSMVFDTPKTTERPRFFSRTVDLIHGSTFHCYSRPFGTGKAGKHSSILVGKFFCKVKVKKGGATWPTFTL